MPNTIFKYDKAYGLVINIDSKAIKQSIIDIEADYKADISINIDGHTRNMSMDEFINVIFPDTQREEQRKFT